MVSGGPTSGIPTDPENGQCRFSTASPSKFSSTAVVQVARVPLCREERRTSEAGNWW